jgi:hypothetical protein
MKILSKIKDLIQQLRLDKMILYFDQMLILFENMKLKIKK